MPIVFDDLIWISDSALLLYAGVYDIPDPYDAFSGQANGLCGGASLGSLLIWTGLNTGKIPVRVILADAAPELGDWDDIVEVSLIPQDDHQANFGGYESEAASFPIPAASYRVRWCASGMDAAFDGHVTDETPPAPDRYEMTLWPAPVARDVVLRETSDLTKRRRTAGFTQERPARASHTPEVDADRGQIPAQAVSGEYVGLQTFDEVTTGPSMTAPKTWLDKPCENEPTTFLRLIPYNPPDGKFPSRKRS